MLLLALFPIAAKANTGDYVQPVWFSWSKTVLDVVIVPPEHGQVVNDSGLLGGNGADELNPYTSSYMQAIEKGVKDWDTAVEQFGSASLKSKLVTNIYVLGRDEIPAQVLSDVEILITTDQTKTVVLGFALTGSFIAFDCLVDNSKFYLTSFSYADMYNVNGQEYGHCLGLNHVGVENAPQDNTIKHDVMNGSYADSVGAAGTHLHCMSNLNVKGLDAVFDGNSSTQRATLAPSLYQKISC